jgi:hypothetical protein
MVSVPVVSCAVQVKLAMLLYPLSLNKKALPFQEAPLSIVRCLLISSFVS